MVNRFAVKKMAGHPEAECPRTVPRERRARLRNQYGFGSMATEIEARRKPPT